MISYDRLIELLRYEPDNGLWYWRVTKGNAAAVAGALAGSFSEGRRRIQIDGQSYYANQLAWLYMTGKWPDGRVDHKNRDKSDDRWCNFRLATNSQNGANCSARSHNRLGKKGVSARKGGRYQARIRCGGKLINLGMFATADEAHAAYVAAAKRLFGEFASAA